MKKRKILKIWVKSKVVIKRGEKKERKERGNLEIVREKVKTKKKVKKKKL
jgi:hypothetical protein